MPTTTELKKMLLGMGLSHQANFDQRMQRGEVILKKEPHRLGSTLPSMLPSWGMAWARSAFSQLEVSTKLAASMMATSIPIEIAEILELPWACFGINIPAKILSEDPGFILVHHTSRGSVEQLLFLDGTVTIGSEPSLGDYADCEARDHRKSVSWAEGELEESKRITPLVGRLILGCCMEFKSIRPTLESRIASQRSIHTRHGEPTVWTYQLTRNVKLDVREAIRHYLRTGEASPTVQTLVRGHWKNQVCGTGRADRKYMHIEPYWRGPEDAPIAVRSHEVG